MPIFEPDSRFEGQDVYIIGGGPSLVGFDWKELENKNTIGCNSAFRLGIKVCSLLLFSDIKWYEKFYEDLKEWTGTVITHYPKLKDAKEDWLYWMERDTQHGLSATKLGYGGNTGCGAINLALILGAKRVFLLGFDCEGSETERPNWHTFQIEKVRPEAHEKHIKGFEALAADLPKIFPGCEVINMNPDSKIICFPFSTPKIAA